MALRERRGRDGARAAAAHGRRARPQPRARRRGAARRARVGIAQEHLPLTLVDIRREPRTREVHVPWAGRDARWHAPALGRGRCAVSQLPLLLLMLRLGGDDDSGNGGDLLRILRCVRRTRVDAGRAPGVAVPGGDVVDVIVGLGEHRRVGRSVFLIMVLAVVVLTVVCLRVRAAVRPGARGRGGDGGVCGGAAVPGEGAHARVIVVRGRCRGRRAELGVQYG
ncbi:hypothetical protein BD413DRAFT_554801 [Trametes elegans]|nr:hypothetical protein BD413DRAFT_554801 [Trametes elegans]